MENKMTKYSFYIKHPLFPRGKYVSIVEREDKSECYQTAIEVMKTRIHMNEILDSKVMHFIKPIIGLKLSQMA
jgi:hypothetical protein